MQPRDDGIRLDLCALYGSNEFRSTINASMYDEVQSYIAYLRQTRDIETRRAASCFEPRDGCALMQNYLSTQAHEITRDGQAWQCTYIHARPSSYKVAIKDVARPACLDIALQYVRQPCHTRTHRSWTLCNSSGGTIALQDDMFSAREPHCCPKSKKNEDRWRAIAALLLRLRSKVWN